MDYLLCSKMIVAVMWFVLMFTPNHPLIRFGLPILLIMLNACLQNVPIHHKTRSLVAHIPTKVENTPTRFADSDLAG